MNELVNTILIKTEIERFRSSIEKFNSQTAIQNMRMLRLTYAITFLTFVMLIAVGAQLYISVFKPTLDTSKEVALKQTPETVTLKPKQEPPLTPKIEKKYNKSLNRIGAKDAPPG